MHVQPFWSVVLICSTLKRGLTCWTHIHHSCQWFWSAQTLKRDSHAGCNACSAVLVSGSDWSNIGKGLTNWIHVQPSSVVLIFWNTEKGLTCWMNGQPFLSLILICLTSGTHFLDTCSTTDQWFWSAQTQERDLLPGCMSAILICLNTGKGLTRWKNVQPFLSVVLICSNTRDGLTVWMIVQPFWSVVQICSNTGGKLTSWMHVWPFLSVVLIWSNSREQLTS